MALGGEIVVQLRMDDGQFRPAIVKSTDMVRAYKKAVGEADAAVNRLERSNETLGRRFRDIVLTLGNLRFVAMDINDIFLRLPMSILRTAGELEKMQQLMTGLSTETDAAKRKLEGMKDMNFVIGTALNAPFDMQALSDSFVKFKTAGIDPTNGSMQALIDSVARFGGTGESLKRASIAIQQMAGKGVVSMEELRQQLGEAVPTAMKNMAEGLEMSMADLAKAVSKGTVQAGPALQRMFIRMEADNAGAAAEMMNTWVGMQAQLKTEWELTAKQIADNGFMAAAKDAIKQINELLRNEEFKEFGVSAGQGLASTVNAIVDTVKWLVKYREEIGAIIAIWAGYKVIDRIIAPVGQSIQRFVTQDLKGMADQARMMASNARARQDYAIQEAASATLAAEAKTRSLQAKLLADQQELASVRAKNQQVLAEDAKVAAQLRAMQIAEQKYNVNNYGAQQSAMRRLDELAAKNTALLRRERELQQAIPQTAAALAVSTNAARVHNAELGRLTTAMGLSRAASIASAAAMRTFGAVSAFLGGPVGIAITVIGGLVYAWNRVTNAAKEAAEAQERAANRQSQRGDIELLEEAAKKAARAKDMAYAAMRDSTKTDTLATGMSGMPVVRQKTKQEQEADVAAYRAALEADRKAWQALQDAKTNLAEQAANQRAQNRAVDLQRELRDIDSATQQRVAKLKSEKQEYIKANGENSKEAVKGIAEINQRIDKEMEAGLKKRMERVEAVMKDARAKASTFAVGSEGRIENDAIADKAAEELDQLRNRLEQRTKSFNPQEIINGGAAAGAGKAPKDSPFERLIEQLRADREQLDAELAGFEKTEQKADVVAGAVARIQQKIANGDFGKLTPGQQKIAVDMTRENAEREQRKKQLEKEVQAIDAVTSFIESRRPEIEAAMELIADPLGTATRGQLEKRAARFVGNQDNIEKIEIYARRLGKTVEEVKKQLIGDAQAADVANVFGKIAQETQTINASMVDDARDAARKRAEADNERHRQVMENLIREREANGAGEAELARLRELMGDNMAARAQKLEQDFKTPLEKLAQSWGSVTKNMEEASVGWANSTADAFTNLVMTGKADFKSLADSIIKDLIRIQIQKAIAAAINVFSGGSGSLFAFANGGIMTETGSAPLKKYANGGIANSPQLALFGEGSMPEAYVPLPDGRTIPVTLKGAGQGGSQVVNQVEVNITVNKDGTTNTSTSGEEANSYRMMGERIRAVIQEEMLKQTRPGGMLYR